MSLTELHRTLRNPTNSDVMNVFMRELKTKTTGKKMHFAMSKSTKSATAKNKSATTEPSAMSKSTTAYSNFTET